MKPDISTEEIENDVLKVVRICYGYLKNRVHQAAISLTETIIKYYCEKFSTLTELQVKEDLLQKFVFEQQRMGFWIYLDDDEKRIELITFQTNQKVVTKGIEIILSTITEPITRTTLEAVWSLSKWLKVSLLFNVWAAFAEIRRNIKGSCHSVGVAEFKDISQGVDISEPLAIMKIKPLE